MLNSKHISQRPKSTLVIIVRIDKFPKLECNHNSLLVHTVPFHLNRSLLDSPKPQSSLKFLRPSQNQYNVDKCKGREPTFISCSQPKSIWSIFHWLKMPSKMEITFQFLTKSSLLVERDDILLEVIRSGVDRNFVWKRSKSDKSRDVSLVT